MRRAPALVARAGRTRGLMGSISPRAAHSRPQCRAHLIRPATARVIALFNLLISLIARVKTLCHCNADSESISLAPKEVFTRLPIVLLSSARINFQAKTIRIFLLFSITLQDAVEN